MTRIIVIQSVKVIFESDAEDALVVPTSSYLEETRSTATLHIDKENDPGPTTVGLSTLYSRKRLSSDEEDMESIFDHSNSDPDYQPEQSNYGKTTFEHWKIYLIM